MIKTIIPKSKYDSWQKVSFGRFATEYLDGYHKYEDTDGNDWYVPVDRFDCRLCRGTGELCHNADDVYCESCFDCDGTGDIEKPIFDLAMAAEDFTSMRRQQRYLEKRYGRIPRQISDYWVKAS